MCYLRKEIECKSPVHLHNHDTERPVFALRIITNDLHEPLCALHQMTN